MNIPACDRLEISETEGRISIPFGANQNDKGCLFAGSIYAGGIVAAYRAAERCLDARGLAGALVAKTATVRYLKSIATDGVAVADVCGEPLLKPNGNYALSVAVEVRDASGVPCAEVQAEMILMKPRPPTA